MSTVKKPFLSSGVAKLQTLISSLAMKPLYINCGIAVSRCGEDIRQVKGSESDTYSVFLEERIEIYIFCCVTL